MRHFIIFLLLSFFSLHHPSKAQEVGRLVLPSELTNKEILQASDIVYAILHQGNMRLSFEEIEVSPLNAITVADALKKWGMQSQDSLSKKDKELLVFAKELRERGAPDSTVVEYIKPTFTLSQLGDTLSNPSAVLERITQLIPDYSLTKSNGSYVLFWNKAKYPKITKLRIQQATPLEAYSILVEKVFKDMDLIFMSLDPSLPYQNDTEKRISLDFHDADLYTVLTRFAEALGPDVIWGISGTASHRLITFSRFKANSQGYRQ